MASTQERNKYFVYVGSVPSELGKQDILNFFKNQGISIKYNKKKSRPEKRYFVCQAHDESTYKAILKIRMPRIGSSIIQISPFLKSGEKLLKDVQDLDKKVYVGNLPLSAQQIQLYEYFEQFGRVQTCYIPKKKKPNAAFKYAFVTFQNKEDAASIKRLGKAYFNGDLITFRDFSYGNKYKI
jgi:RNA recognition motif-containing protein